MSCSFDQYAHVENPQSFTDYGIAMRKMFLDQDPTGFGYFTRFITGICERQDQMQEQGIEEIAIYGFLYKEVCRAYHVLKENHEGLEEPWRRIKRILETFWRLDEEGLTEERLLPMEPNLPKDESARRLAALDAGRTKFKQHLVDAFGDLHAIADRNLILMFASKTYNYIHGFQAPPRADPKQAYLDAMGLSDHFSELAQEVIDASPEGIP